MCTLIHKIFITGLLILTVLSSVILKGNEVVAKIDKTNDFIVCSKLNDYAVVLTIDIGSVLKSDSLYACNFEIGYNPELIRLGGLLKYSTLAEGLDEESVAAQGDSSGRSIRGFFYSNNLIYGNKPLIALRVELIDTCYKGVIPFNLKYLEFTDEFQKKITSYTEVNVDVIQNDKHTIRIEIPNDTLFFENENLITLPLIVTESNYRNINNGEIILSNMNYENYDILSVNNDDLKIEINEYEQVADSLIIKFSKSNIILDKSIIYLKLKRKKDLHFNNRIKSDIKLNDICNCSINVQTDEVVLEGKIVNSIDNDNDEDNSVLITYYDNNLKIVSERIIESIELIDIRGESIDRISVNSNNYYTSFNDLYSNGTYILIINTDLNKIRKKIFINN